MHGAYFCRLTREQENGIILDFVKALPFSSDVVISSVIPICRLLAVYGKTEV
ncbi:unnamed protein product [Haemonchus placei]|uniref:Uncharacterized protein n=1 Tax=Haemonchus placei TaxID=6290 RepID=A0A0N4W7Y2_HAEPC|nr:unnamed protein product [Haemonchus placei]